MKKIIEKSTIKSRYFVMLRQKNQHYACNIDRKIK